MNSRFFSLTFLLIGSLFSLNSYAQDRDTAPTVQTVLQQYIDAIGGSSAISSVTDVRISGNGKAGNEKVNLSIKIKQPDKYFQEITTASGNKPMMKVIVIGDSININIFKNGKNEQVSQMQRNILKARSQFCPEYGYLQPDHTEKLELLPEKELINGSVANVITIATMEGILFKNYYDAKTGLKVQSVLVSGQEEETPDVVTVYKDYRKVGNIRLPFYFENSTNGKAAFEAVLKKVSINSGESDEEFK
ncbi:hypothetical protein DVR12_03295 [Chitinophaga silvatica]|uniref:Outer membrane lipoprotein-sorting protein n=1 Tax=Chitinophaga silvatica TaxID=2282649 RepID=A0A3E1YHL3_9BACT|nr:hypothetical protein [Chitinophaga silvatica]RFS26824.1 hypothetical protein DVR12_03295 [Chitinophaga silvatica]